MQLARWMRAGSWYARALQDAIGHYQTLSDSIRYYMSVHGYAADLLYSSVTPLAEKARACNSHGGCVQVLCMRVYYKMLSDTIRYYRILK